jgi:hypothetical protein
VLLRCVLLRCVLLRCVRLRCLLLLLRSVQQQPIGLRYGTTALPYL